MKNLSTLLARGGQASRPMRSLAIAASGVPNTSAFKIILTRPSLHELF